ncbi:hypothetical protein Tco_0518386, partial [Tanacetum coccineum]
MKVSTKVAKSPGLPEAREYWDLEKDAWVIVEFHWVETERNWVSVLTGSRVRISDTISCGMDTGRDMLSSSYIL